MGAPGCWNTAGLCDRYCSPRVAVKSASWKLRCFNDDGNSDRVPHRWVHAMSAQPCVATEVDGDWAYTRRRLGWGAQ